MGCLVMSNLEAHGSYIIERALIILGEISDFSKNIALEHLDISRNTCTGNANLDVRGQNRNFYEFVLGGIGDFSKNVNLTHLHLARNGLTGNTNLDFHQSSRFRLF